MLDRAWVLTTVAARTAIVLIALVAGIRIFGKHNLGEMNLVDVVMVLLLANAVQNAMTYGAGFLSVGLVSALVLLLLDRQLGFLAVTRPRLERLLKGGPVVLATDGHLDQAAMRREKVTEDQVIAAARDMGLADIDRVRLAVLEPNGEISIIPKEEDRPASG
jgi:uncharacterized membrane protein YcaP (DUF421 family)